MKKTKQEDWKYTIQLPHHNYKTAEDEMREEIHIPTKPDEMVRMIIKEYEKE